MTKYERLIYHSSTNVLRAQEIDSMRVSRHVLAHGSYGVLWNLTVNEYVERRSRGLRDCPYYKPPELKETVMHKYC
jgi:hypothetical protein